VVSLGERRNEVGKNKWRTFGVVYKNWGERVGSWFDSKIGILVERENDVRKLHRD